MQEYDRGRCYTASKSGLQALKPRLENLPSELDSFTSQIYNMGAGVEIEAEDVLHRDVMRNLLSNLWTFHEDPSLRGMSCEFVSRFGCRLGTVLDMVKHFYEVNAMLKTPITFGERTSVHVHIDARMFSRPQITTLAKLYLLCEDSLFAFVGGNRHHNIYCVPLLRVFPFSGKSIHHYAKERDRYAAMNCASLMKYGTVEFRHLGGTDDAEKVRQWILLCGMLVRTAFIIPESSVNKMIEEVAEKSDTTEALEEIFREHARLLIPVKGVRAEDVACLASGLN